MDAELIYARFQTGKLAAHDVQFNVVKGAGAGSPSEGHTSSQSGKPLGDAGGVVEDTRQGFQVWYPLLIVGYVNATDG